MEFETWLAEQSDEVRTLIEQRQAAGADERHALEAELHELREKTKSGAESAQRMEEAERRSQFYEEAFRFGITNVKLAYLLAREEKLFDASGDANWAQLRARYPEVFSGRATPSRIGSGLRSGATPSEDIDMNAWIRQVAGR